MDDRGGERRRKGTDIVKNRLQPHPLSLPCFIISHSHDSAASVGVSISEAHPDFTGSLTKSAHYYTFEGTSDHGYYHAI